MRKILTAALLAVSTTTFASPHAALCAGDYSILLYAMISTGHDCSIEIRTHGSDGLLEYNCTKFLKFQASSAFEDWLTTGEKMAALPKLALNALAQLSSCQDEVAIRDVLRIKKELLELVETLD